MAQQQRKPRWSEDEGKEGSWGWSEAAREGNNISNVSSGAPAAAPPMPQRSLARARFHPPITFASNRKGIHVHQQELFPVREALS